MNKMRAILAGTALLCLLAFGMSTSVAAQGRGGGGGGRGGSGGGGMGGGRPTGVGVDRGIGTASERSGGRSDAGRSRASENSNGRSDEGLARARAARDNSQRGDKELRRNPQIADALNRKPEQLRRDYEAALADNPNLKFGQFVAANMLARNLGANNPRVTTTAILDGLADGDSIGQTLQNLGVSKQEARDAARRLERERKQRQK
jgi:hypothetical protein